MAQHWNLFFPAYLIWDGWGHISEGQELPSHGLEFGAAQPLLTSTDRRKSAVPAADFGYSATVEVVFRSDKACLIDFGLIAVGKPGLLPNEAGLPTT